MAIDALFATSRSALGYERARIEAASKNIAEANQPLAPGQSARVHRAALPAFALALDGAGRLADGVPPLLTESVATRAVHDPGHPLADASGQVHYPAVDLVQEMATLMSASRSYEANVRAVNTLRSMLFKALEIGGGQ